MRVLKRGTRGEDVLLWQRFLMRQRDNPEFGFTAPAIRLDGIFGRETARATVAFQQRVQLREIIASAVILRKRARVAQTWLSLLIAATVRLASLGLVYLARPALGSMFPWR